MNVHVHIHQDEHTNAQLNRLERMMATVKEIVTAIDKKTDQIADDVAAEALDIADVKVLIQKLKDGQTDPALEAQAQAALDKLTGVEGKLKETEQTLNAVGKDGTIT